MTQEISLLLVGALIAILSSFVTTVFNILIQFKLEKQNKLAANLEKAHHLTGRMSVLTSQTDDSGEWIKNLQTNVANLEQFLAVSKKDPNLLAGIMGVMEEGIKKTLSLEEKIREDEVVIRDLYAQLSNIELNDD